MEKTTYTTEHSRSKLGLAGLLLSALVASNSALAAPIELVANGGFETGVLGPWTNSGLGASGTCPSDNRDWNVSTSASSTGCSSPADPSGSTYAAYVMNDGTGPLTYQLIQSIFVPLGTTSGALSFDWTSVNQFDTGRTLRAMINGTQVFSSSTIGSFGWTTVGSIDISALLAAAAGTSINVEFDNFIPVVWTGPAGLGLDNVSVTADGSVPEPGSIALLAVALLGAALASKRKRA